MSSFHKNSLLATHNEENKTTEQKERDSGRDIDPRVRTLRVLLRLTKLMVLAERETMRQILTVNFAFVTRFTVRLCTYRFVAELKSCTVVVTARVRENEECEVCFWY